MTVGSANWIQLEGGVNARDVGGLPAGEGARVRSGVLIRSASLQHLTEADVAHLVGDLGVRRVVDLRTDVEVTRQAPGPMHAQPAVVVHHLSLYPDRGTVDRAELLPGSRPEPPAPLPWQHERLSTEHGPVIAGY